MTNHERGMQALQFFLDKYAQIWPDRNQPTLSLLINTYGTKVDNIGEAIIDAEYPDDILKHAMQNLAILTPENTVPYWAEFFNVLADPDITRISVMNAAVTEVAQDVKETVTTGLNVGKYVLMGLVAVIIVSYLTTAATTAKGFKKVLLPSQ